MRWARWPGRPAGRNVGLGGGDRRGAAGLEGQPRLVCSMLAPLGQQGKTLKSFHVASVLRDVTQLGCLMLPMEDLLKAAPSAAAGPG